VAVCLPNSRLVRVLAAGLERPLAIAGVTPGSGSNCRSGEEVFARYSTSVPLILDGGHLPGDRQPTVLDLTIAPPVVRQEGSITREMLSPWLQQV
jgi:L-threonylcarbamoyladenylate synthase